MDIKRIVMAWRYDRAVKKANRLRQQTGYKHMVINYNGKTVVVSRKRLKELIAQGKFRKGVDIYSIERVALYKTL